jgi:hypothetical protein
VRYALGQTRQALVPLKRALELTPQDEELRQFYEQVLREVEGNAQGKKT